MLSTSGSTGAAKFVRLSHVNLDANARSIAEYLDIMPDDCAATTLPFHYCYGLSVINSHLLVGGRLLLTDASVVDDQFWEDCLTHGVTSFAGVPYTFELLDRVGFEDKHLSTLRTITKAGGRLPANQVRRYREMGERAG
jgi:acyl-coenzyme A synthetase/AMP-(fatty) acid ligase